MGLFTKLRDVMVNPPGGPQGVMDAAHTNRWGLGGGITGNQNSRTSWDDLGGGYFSQYPGARRVGRLAGTLIGGYSAGSYLGGLFGGGSSSGLTPLGEGPIAEGPAAETGLSTPAAGGLSGFLSQYGQYGNLLSNVLGGQGGEGGQGSGGNDMFNYMNSPSRFQQQPYDEIGPPINLEALFNLIGQPQQQMSMPDSLRISGGGLI